MNLVILIVHVGWVALCIGILHLLGVL